MGHNGQHRRHEADKRPVHSKDVLLPWGVAHDRRRDGGGDGKQTPGQSAEPMTRRELSQR